MEFKELIKEQTEYKAGVYVATNLTKETEKKILEYQKANLGDADLNTDIHCTLIYSKKPLKGEVKTKSYTYTGTFKGFALFGPEQDTLVIEVECPEMVERNAELVKEYGFISDYDEYKPHVTLSYGAKGIDLTKLPAIDFDIEFTAEYVEELDEDWTDKKEGE